MMQIEDSKTCYDRVITKNVQTYLPSLVMEEDRPIRLYKNKSANDRLPARLNYYRLCWTVRGYGEYLIDFRSYGLRSGRLFLILPGQVFRPLKEGDENRIVEFSPMLIESRLGDFYSIDSHGFTSSVVVPPYVDLRQEQLKTLETLFNLLHNQLDQINQWTLLAQYICLMVIQANNFYLNEYQLKVLQNGDAIIPRLRKLINLHYKTERFATFYANQLGIVPRKLNEITLATTGRLVEDIVFDRIMAEAEALLACTSILIKEITYELGFHNQAHFAFFFHKRNQKTPKQYRQWMHGFTQIKKRANTKK